MRSLPGRVVLLICSLIVVLATLAGAGVVVKRLIDNATRVVTPPASQGCWATADGRTAFVTPEQAKWASVIVAESIRRNLPPRAASIALATAMQESSLRNIDYGDRDSLGLFQQRPSQGWGTAKQIMDPWYSSGKFYDHLVKVEGWQTGDINDVAQKVQRSGVPDGYRKHVEEAKVLASVLTGNTPAGLSCVIRDDSTPEPSVHAQVLDKGLKGKVSTARTATSLTLTARDETLAWAAAHLMMANLRDARVRTVTVGSAAGQGQRWELDPNAQAAWSGTPMPGGKVAVVTLG